MNLPCRHRNPHKDGLEYHRDWNKHHKRQASKRMRKYRENWGRPDYKFQDRINKELASETTKGNVELHFR